MSTTTHIEKDIVELANSLKDHALRMQIVVEELDRFRNLSRERQAEIEYLVERQGALTDAIGPAAATEFRRYTSTAGEPAYLAMAARHKEAQKEVQRLTADNQRLHEALCAAEDTNTSTQALLKDRDAQLLKCYKDVDMLDAELKAVKDARGAVGKISTERREQLDQCRLKIRQLEEALQARTSEMDRLRDVGVARTAEMDQRRVESNKIIAAHGAELEQVKAHLANAQNEIKRLNTMYDGSAAEVRMLRQVINDAKFGVCMATNPPYLTDGQGSTSVTAAEVLKLRAENKSSADQIAALKRELEERRERQDRAAAHVGATDPAAYAAGYNAGAKWHENVARDLVDARKQNRELQCEVNLLKTEGKDLRAVSEATQQKHADVLRALYKVKLRVQFDCAPYAIVTLDGSDPVANFEARKRRIASLEEHVKTIETALAVLETDAATLRFRVAALEAHTTALETANAGLDAARDGVVKRLKIAEELAQGYCDAVHRAGCMLMYTDRWLLIPQPTPSGSLSYPGPRSWADMAVAVARKEIGFDARDPK